MIARIWQGSVKAADFEAYTEFMKSRAIPDYQSTPGFVRLQFLRRMDGDTGHFTLITYWENLAVIKHFAGEDYEKAKYYPEDQQYLLHFAEKVVHHELFAEG
ncbi:MAG: antibiotic biosynthesis monooxygenase [Bacteroidota bacterium]